MKDELHYFRITRRLSRGKLRFYFLSWSVLECILVQKQKQKIVGKFVQYVVINLCNIGSL